MSISRADEYVSICCALSVVVAYAFPSLARRPRTSLKNRIMIRTWQDDISDAQGYIDCNDVELGIMVIKCSINKVL